MSHTLETDSVLFHHNGYSGGDVEIVNDGSRVTVPTSALVAFVAELRRRRIIARLENSSDDDVLSGRWLDP